MHKIQSWIKYKLEYLWIISERAGKERCPPSKIQISTYLCHRLLGNYSESWTLFMKVLLLMCVSLFLFLLSYWLNTSWSYGTQVYNCMQMVTCSYEKPQRTDMQPGITQVKSGLLNWQTRKYCQVAGITWFLNLLSIMKGSICICSRKCAVKDFL